MNILVTGGTGFIGSHLAEKLSSEGHVVTVFDNMMRGEESFRNLKEMKQAHPNIELVVGNILDFEKVKEAVKDKDVVYHLAALPSHRLALEQPREYAMIDIMGTVNFLEASRLSNTNPTVVFGSSNKVYGKNQTPFSENLTPMPEGPYGQAKISSEDWCKQYAEYYGVNTPIVRFHHVIGPRCQPDLVLSIFTERIINGEQPIVHGQFEDEQFTSCAADFTNVFDAIRGTQLTSQVKGFDVFNLGTGKVTTIEEMAKLIMRHLNKEVPIEYKQMMKHEALTHCANTQKAKEKLGFEATVPIEESIKQYVDWRLKTGQRKQAKYR